MENTKVKNQNLNYVLLVYLVKTSKKALFEFRIMTKCSCGHNKGDHKSRKIDRRHSQDSDGTPDIPYYCKFCVCAIDEFGEQHYMSDLGVC